MTFCLLRKLFGETNIEFASHAFLSRSAPSHLASACASGAIRNTCVPRPCYLASACSLAIPASPIRRSWPVMLLSLELGVTSCPRFSFETASRPMPSVLRRTSRWQRSALCLPNRMGTSHHLSVGRRSVTTKPPLYLYIGDGQGGAISTSKAYSSSFEDEKRRVPLQAIDDTGFSVGRCNPWKASRHIF